MCNGAPMWVPLVPAASPAATSCCHVVLPPVPVFNAVEQDAEVEAEPGESEAVKKIKRKAEAVSARIERALKRQMQRLAEQDVEVEEAEKKEQETEAAFKMACANLDQEFEQVLQQDSDKVYDQMKEMSPSSKEVFHQLFNRE